MSKQIIKVPDLGGADSVEVIEIVVALGDVIELEQSLLVLESDKATMDVPSDYAGVVTAILVKEGDTVSEGSAIIELELNVDDQVEVVETEIVETGVAVDEPESAAVAPVASSAAQLVSVPDIGSDGEVDVIELAVAIGDRVEEGDSLLVLESDKATMEVPAPFAGEIVEWKLAVGDKVATGAAVAMMIADSAALEIVAAEPVLAVPVAIAESAPSLPVVESVAAPSPTVAAELEMVSHANVHAGPAVRHLARELGVNLAMVAATGPRQRILKEDVHAYVKSSINKAETTVLSANTATGIPKIPTIDFSKFGEIEKIKMSKIQKMTAANMQRSWLNVPHVTQFDDADITDLELFRKSMQAEGEKRGVKVTPVAFMIKAIATALQQNPAFNRSLHADGEHFIQKNYIHIGMAVDTPRGLMVPVVRDVDKKAIWQIAAEVLEMAGKARDGKLLPVDMQGGCFTISSLGAIGGNGFTPIVNAPEVGILGVSRSHIKPIWNGNEFAPRQMLPLSLSYDHRVINGGDAGRFMTTLVALLSDIRRLVM